MGLLTNFAHKKEESSASEESTEEEEESTSTSSESEEGSAESNPSPKKMVRRKKSKKKESKLWQSNLSARNNQDIQRAYEEIAVKEMTAILNKNSLNENVRNCRTGFRNPTPLGGLWVRLEAEWKESYNQIPPQQRARHIFTTGKIHRLKAK